MTTATTDAGQKKVLLAGAAVVGAWKRGVSLFMRIF